MNYPRTRYTNSGQLTADGSHRPGRSALRPHGDLAAHRGNLGFRAPPTSQQITFDNGDG